MAVFQFQNPFAAAVVIMCVSFIFYSPALGEQGIASYYTPPYVPSSCYGYQEQGTMIAAARQEIFAGRAACGKFYTVTCTGGTNQGTPQPCYNGTSVTVKVVDLCPSCSGRGRDFDLSQEAFAAIANTDSGLIRINYQQAG
uniref:EG45-like domain containing protein n=2 Tax=Rhizophora mucronata TaxID=61149 RepID=A0A2P2IZQ7_RHIMU